MVMLMPRWYSLPLGGDVFLREQGMIVPTVVEIPLGKIMDDSTYGGRNTPREDVFLRGQRIKLWIKWPGTSVNGSSYVICDCDVFRLCMYGYVGIDVCSLSESLPVVVYYF